MKFLGNGALDTSLKYVSTFSIGLLFHSKYHSGDQVKKTEMGRACGTYGGEERCIQGFSGET
jgi:hypothetical protein